MSENPALRPARPAPPFTSPPVELPPRDGVRCIKNVLLPTSDGVRLAMDLHVPDGDTWASTPLPVLLEYIPYRKDDAPPYSGVHFALARQGYIGARLDCRGTGSSEGVVADEYSPREQQDGAEAVEWIARQPWCSGKVGMFGASYGGFTALQVAALQPPHLATIVPMYFTDDRYTDDCHYRGGALRCYYDVGAYGASMIGMNAMPPYPENGGADWARVWEQHLDGNEPYLLNWLAHQTDGDYWRSGSLRDGSGSGGGYDRIRCPVFLIGGWRDGYPNPPLRTFAGLQSPKKVLVGPWNHSRPDVALPGPRIDWVPEMVRWCDHWLKGEPNGVPNDPPVTIYMQRYDPPLADRSDTTGYWRVEPEFPFPGATEQALYLHPAGRCSSAPPAAPVGDEPEGDEFAYRPTTGTAGGLWSGGVPFGLPTDQRPDEIGALTSTSEPLVEPLEIAGWPQAVLHVSSSAPVMAFVARLCDVAPEGTSALVCSGVLNATRRDSLTDPQPLTPGAVYQLRIELDCTAWRFEPGHRIRLSISSADFPNLWPTPYPGTNRVLRGASHPSRLLLPVLPTRAPEDETTLPPASPTPAPYRLAPDEPVWQIVQDVLGDRTGLRTHTRGAVRPGPGTEVTSEAGLDVWASNRDPADVVATGTHHRRIARPEGVTTVDTRCSVRSTETAFHVSIELDVVTAGLPHHQRRWTRTYPRHLL